MRLDYDLKLSTKVEAAHPIWAKPFQGGPLKALFVPSIRLGREIVELLQRTDIEHENVTIDRYWDLNRWGMGDFYHKRGGKGDFGLLYRNLERALTSDESFDVMVLPGINGWGHFTKKTREAILQRVESGAGLVLIHPFHGEGMDRVEELDRLSPLRSLHEEGFNESGYPSFDFEKLGRDRWIPRRHYITKGTPFELFPYDEMAYYPYAADGEVILESESGMPIAAVKEYGKGRVVAFGYYARDILPQHGDFTWFDKCFEPLVENWHGPFHRLPFNYLEYLYGLVYKSMVWAARREPELQIESVTEHNGAMHVRVAGNEAADTVLSYRIKNRYDQIVQEGETFSPSLPIPHQAAYGGQFRFEVLLKENGRIADWYTTSIARPPVAGIALIAVDKACTQPGDSVSVHVTVEGREADLEVQAVDDFGRVLDSRKRKAVQSESVAIDYDVPRLRSLRVTFRAIVTLDGCTVHRMDSAPIIVKPMNRKLDDFEILMCPQNRGQGDLVALEAKLLHEMGITGSFIGDSKMSTTSGAEGCGIGWWERAPYVEMKEKYMRTKDKAVLHRTPCLNDPDFQRRNEEEIARTMQVNAKYGPLAYFAQDEGSITCYSDELDLCFCPHCMRELRIWLQDAYSDLHALNESWGTTFSNWDDVVPYDYFEARRTGDYASWGDHRLFMERTYANGYKQVRDAIRKADPEGGVRMSGCQASTPYTGCDYYLLHQVVGYFEAYGVGNQYELHRSFARPGTTIGAWFGYGHKGTAVRHKLWNALLHGITLISIFWEYSCLNPDFTYSQSAVDMGDIFKEIKREGIGKLLLYGAKRESLGIAVHYSMPSIHGSYIREDFARYQANRQGWIHLMEDLGYQYRFIASQQIEQGELIRAGYKLLILPYSIALGTKELQEIRTFVEQGGVVIGDMQTGLMDEHCRLYEQGRADDLFGIERLATDTQPFYINGELSQTGDFPYFDLVLYGSSELTLMERGTRAGAGKAGYVDDFSRHVASVVVNEYGKGKAVYLNLSLDSYPQQRKESNGGAAPRTLMSRLFDLAGVEKPLRLTTIDDRTIENGFETVYYTDGSALYAAILRDREGDGRIGYDGLAVDDGDIATRTAKSKIRVTLRRKAHVYDIRTKQYLGYTDSAELAVAGGDVKLLSLLPYRVTGIELDITPRVQAGEQLSIGIRLLTDKPENTYSHTVSISLYDPSGEFAWMYSESVVLDGIRHLKTCGLPFNEACGEWKVVVKDVATGVTAGHGFEVYPYREGETR